MKEIKIDADIFTKEELLSFAVFLKKINMTPSTSVAKRLIEGGAIKVFIKEN